MPISVVVPPRSATKESGISAFEVETPRVAATAVMIGRNITTTGVSLTTALVTMAANMTMMTEPMPLRPPRRASIAAGRSSASVWNRPWPTMSMASTVTRASLEKPASTSVVVSGVSVPKSFGTSQNTISQYDEGGDRDQLDRPALQRIGDDHRRRCRRRSATSGWSLAVASISVAARASCFGCRAARRAQGALWDRASRPTCFPGGPASRCSPPPCRGGGHAGAASAW